MVLVFYSSTDLEIGVVKIDVDVSTYVLTNVIIVDSVFSCVLHFVVLNGAS